MPRKLRELQRDLRAAGFAERLGKGGHYSLVIEWDERERIFVVAVPELPGCMTHGATYEEAVKHAQEAIASVLEARAALGRPIPAPRTFPCAITPDV